MVTKLYIILVLAGECFATVLNWLVTKLF